MFQAWQLFHSVVCYSGLVQPERELKRQIGNIFQLRSGYRIKTELMDCLAC